MLGIALLSVHPRERGEQQEFYNNILGEPGSSPRARGTGLREANARGARRFIPASAGNSQTERGVLGMTLVHPRERGEQLALQ